MHTFYANPPVQEFCIYNYNITACDMLQMLDFYILEDKNYIIFLCISSFLWSQVNTQMLEELIVKPSLKIKAFSMILLYTLIH